MYVFILIFLKLTVSSRCDIVRSILMEHSSSFMICNGMPFGSISSLGGLSNVAEMPVQDALRALREMGVEKQRTNCAQGSTFFHLEVSGCVMGLGVPVACCATCR